MKLTAAVLMMAMAAGSAWAQAPAKKKAPASQAVSGETAAAPASPTKSKTAARPAAKAEAAQAAPAAAATKYAGKRDPFISPVVARMGTGPGTTCTTGKRCLVVDQLSLRGVVRTPNGWIAVVANTANKAYFLRENDPIFNGYVLKITGDSVVFKENVLDNLGRQTTREVVKKVNAPAV